MSSLNFSGASKQYTAENAPAAKSIEGYILIITNLHPETTEDHIYDVFEEYVRVSNMHLNLDRRTGFVKGYALLQFTDLEDAKEIMEIHNSERFQILGRTIDIDYAFVESPSGTDRSKFKSKKIESRFANNRLEEDDDTRRDISPSR